MNRDLIQFKQQREMGEIISVSFKFLRENYKTYFRLLIKVAGPAFLLLIAALSYYSYSTLGDPLNSEMFMSGGFVISFGILALTLLLYFSVVYATVFNLIKSYIENEGEIKDAEVAAWAKDDLGKMFGLNIISWIFIFAGMMLFLIPGIYVSVPLSIAMAALIFKQQSIFESITEGFKLVKDNWWMSFLTLVFVWIIIYVISLIFQLPLIIYTFVKAFTSVNEGSAADMSEVFDWVYILFSIISSLVQYIFYSIIPIGIAFLYFHLNEKKNFTGTYERIDKLGNNS
ncbi:hypothetical protein [Salegentibacter flavus]|uniref:Membrane domain of glycerophosphoryl diester phosphodiesterase n=1 Tax=Salegentibacter flavus TaxID=287099 RepID=A0A1I5CFC5_9FLAO|nr:hypothetical protein [Salegentibacter flavus]SFN85698.1 hypothetical protein SAMN05660413_02831 [Salegentibacter flavus]